MLNAALLMVVHENELSAESFLISACDNYIAISVIYMYRCKSVATVIVNFKKYCHL